MRARSVHRRLDSGKIGEKPKVGDTILHCGHLDRDKEAEPPAYWFRYETTVQFERPDKTCGEAEWFAICAPCHAKYKRGGKVTVCADRQWTDDEKVYN
jgi:hypothetical protein